ncbi:MAG TPA: integrase arm-type DNA-binding domain-containing protein, partial [Plasticicumulans sp.]|nr:integrase arm-type DNA-binding domain-containing protein [Plasticicumulans sp.]
MTDSALPRTRNRTAANRLSDAELRRQMPVGKHTDGGGLYLEVTEAGNKLWRYRYRINGREQLMAMGAYPEVSLAEARKARDAARERVKTGINPSHERKIERARRAVESAQTFVAVSAEWIEKRGGKWSASYREQVQRILQNDILPALGPFPMRQLSAAQILELMNAAEARGAATVALLIRQIV